jgi:hypothetical protein
MSWANDRRRRDVLMVDEDIEIASSFNAFCRLVGTHCGA